MMEFNPMPKIPRLFRDIVITEKIDGTNASVFVPESPDEPLRFGSRTKWITPENDNHGFARWGAEHSEELRYLGPGHHFGEWWGSGINRGYGLKEKRFSLFNTNRWGPLRDKEKYHANTPACCHVVPALYTGSFSSYRVIMAARNLEKHGSYAASGYTRPEGIVVFHTAAGNLFKYTLEGDAKG